MSNENKKQSQKNTTAVMVALIAALVAGVLILVIALGSIFSDDAGDEKTPYIISTEAQEDTTVSGVDTDNDILVGDVENESTAADGNNGGQQAENPDNSVNNGDGKNPVDNDEDKETQNSAIEYYEQLSPNGDNKLSDHYDNKYIKKISKEYKVDSDLLVAIYSVPDTGNNFVLQFNGRKDSSGNIIKSPDTLEKVYQIDKSGNVSVATGKQTGNVGVSYAEGMLCFNMVKKLVMTQYPEYFTGLE